MATTLKIGMSLHDFMERYDQVPFELIEGEMIPVSPQAIESIQIAGRLFRLLADYVEANKLGEAYMEGPFTLKPADDPTWVKGSRVPDVMFVKADRLKALAEADQKWRKGPLPLAPDLVVEIVSPTDSFTDVMRKIDGYLRDGVKLAWVIDPEQKVVTIHVPDSNQITRLSEEDVLSGGEVVAGFEIPIKRLFESM